MTTMAVPFPPKRLTASRSDGLIAAGEAAVPVPAAPVQADRYGQSEAHAARRRELLIRALRG